LREVTLWTLEELRIKAVRWMEVGWEQGVTWYMVPRRICNDPGKNII
jgi:hypothetical protein